MYTLRQLSRMQLQQWNLLLNSFPQEVLNRKCYVHPYLPSKNIDWIPKHI